MRVLVGHRFIGYWEELMDKEKSLYKTKMVIGGPEMAEERAKSEAWYWFIVGHCHS